MVQLGATARLLIVGQAPGRAVHASGVPWDDPSGRRLRDWLDLTPEEFYDPGSVAILPMGFCYPGSGPSGDLPPRGECAPTWHARALAALPEVELTLLVGRHAVGGYAPGFATLTEAVAAGRDRPDAEQLALPHPSPRNQRWLRQHPWFETEVVPTLRERCRSALGLA